MRYILYCRKSSESEDRQVMSLSAQENELKKIAERDGVQIIKVFRESMSAKAPGRPLFAEMMRLFSDGKADGILCWKLDRLARNPIDGGTIQWLLQNSQIKIIRTAERPYLPQDNVVMMSIELGMSNQYIRELSHNVKRGNTEKLRRGEWPNHAPFGYRNNRLTKLIEPDPKTGPAVQRIFALYSTGTYSMKEITKTLYQEGLRTANDKKIAKSKVEKALRNPFYTGRMCRDNEVYDGKHQPLISNEQFDLVQEVLQETTRPRPKKLFFPFRGLVFCAYCECQYTASLKKGHKYLYCTNGKGICTAHRTYMRSEKVRGLFADTLDKIRFDDELVEIMHEAYREKYTDQNKYQDEVRARLERQLAALDDQESSAFEAYTKKMVRVEVYEKQRDKIESERIALKNDLRILPNKNPLATLEQTKAVFLRANGAKKRFLEADEEGQHKIASELLWNLSIEDGKTAKVSYKGVFEILANAPKNGDFETMLRD